MSVTVHQILSDAKKLVSRLRDHDSAADNIIQNSQTLYRNVEAMKEYCEDTSETDAASAGLANSSTAAMLQENGALRALRRENAQLRDALEDHQSCAALLMSRYRANVTRLACRPSPADTPPTEQHTQELQKMADSICEIADVMKQAIKVDEEGFNNDHERLTELITENKGLRELLDISRLFGSLDVPLNTPEMADKQIQTEAIS